MKLLRIACILFAVASSSLIAEEELDDPRKRILSEQLLQKFLEALSVPHSSESARRLNRFLDPEYLKIHPPGEVKRGVFPLHVKKVFKITSSFDPSISVCEIETEEHAIELLIIRTCFRAGKPYILPYEPPDPFGIYYDPWLLRKPRHPGT